VAARRAALRRRCAPAADGAQPPGEAGVGWLSSRCCVCEELKRVTRQSDEEFERSRMCEEVGGPRRVRLARGRERMCRTRAAA
jgi:hypothetical protein